MAGYRLSADCPKSMGVYQEMEVDFTADQPGLTLFHCHMQIHMDYGFMALFDCV